MKIFVRDRQTRMLADARGGWTAEQGRAMEFPSIEAAGETALSQCDRDLVVILSYDQPECQLALNPVYCAPM